MRVTVSSSESEHGPAYVFTPDGAFDVTSTLDLADEIVALALDERAHVTLDLSAASSFDTSALLLVARAGNSFGDRFRVVGASPEITAMLHTNGLAAVLR